MLTESACAYPITSASRRRETDLADLAPKNFFWLMLSSWLTLPNSFCFNWNAIRQMLDLSWKQGGWQRPEILVELKILRVKKNNIAMVVRKCLPPTMEFAKKRDRDCLEKGRTQLLKDALHQGGRKAANFLAFQLQSRNIGEHCEP